MKVAFTSDVHLDFGFLGHLDLKSFDSDADVLVLAGDIIEAVWFKKIHKENNLGNITLVNYTELVQTFEYLSQTYKSIIMVMGNHEHYRGKINKTKSIIESFMKYHAFNNVHVLENDTLVIDDVTFTGCTMWTDMGNAVFDHVLSGSMNDFRHITYNKGAHYRKFRPDDARKIHAESLEFFKDSSKSINGKWVHTSHHAPSLESIPEIYKTNKTTVAYYSQILESLIYGYELPRLPDVYIHGHIHTPVDYMMGDMRVVSNPRGYYGYEDVSNFKVKVIDI